jgi:hypothetical protein
MWHGFCAVDGSYRPIVIESLSDFLIDLLNTGPGKVRVEGWSDTPIQNRESPDFSLELQPGNIRAIRARFVRLGLIEEKGHNRPQYAAVGWRFIAPPTS